MSKNFCLLCDSSSVKPVITFPDTPLANTLFSNKGNAVFYPLGVGICSECGHIQLTRIISPKILFADYPYLSSSGSQALSRLDSLAEDLNSKYLELDRKFVLEIGSNDGYLLSQFKNKGWSVLGIDPAKEASRIAQTKDIDNICDFFSLELAQKIIQRYGTPDLIIANNVLAHTNSMNDIAAGLTFLMGKSTTLVIEFSYAVDIIEQMLFDTIYHEHMSYHSLSPLIKFFNKYELTIYNATKFEAHGGSLRIFLKKNSSEIVPAQTINSLIKHEFEIGIATYETWKLFENRINKLKISINSLLMNLKNSGKRVVGYGVPAKFTTMFYVLGLSEDYFDYLVDDNYLKFGKVAPGTNLKIFNTEMLKSDTPDYIFIFSWNYSESIVQRINNERLVKEGYIVPIPLLTINMIYSS